MDFFLLTFIVPSIAVILDALFGDPQNLPHPVRLIGNGLDLFESLARRGNFNLRLSGLVAVLLFSTGAWAFVELAIMIPYLGIIISIYLSFAGLALGCLIRESNHVVFLLDRGDIADARKALSFLVSRDTSKLDSTDIRRTLAETVSENLNDGFVAPMFYLTIFGPSGLWAYKVVSTMDSMWGYKTDKYIELGYAAAKTDDLLAYIPARITAYLMLLIGKWQGLAYADAWSNFKTDAKKMESPNAGWPMAVAAWLLKAQMGGAAEYFGKMKEKPILGPVGTKWDKKKIHSLIKLCKVTGYTSALVFILSFCWL